jgi:uncharacterized protein YcfJ
MEAGSGGTARDDNLREGVDMNINKTVSLGAAVVAILGAVGFVPASADSRDEAARVVGVVAMAATTETPQDQVWDMTYGPDRPVAPEAEVAQAQAGEEIVDYTFG